MNETFSLSVGQFGPFCASQTCLQHQHIDQLLLVTVLKAHLLDSGIFKLTFEVLHFSPVCIF